MAVDIALVGSALIGFVFAESHVHCESSTALHAAINLHVQQTQYSLFAVIATH